MALTLAELHVDSIPINSLIPIKGTPLENRPRLGEKEILRTVAIYRYVNPAADIRLAGGRALMAGNVKRAFDGYIIGIATNSSQLCPHIIWLHAERL